MWDETCRIVSAHSINQLIHWIKKALIDEFEISYKLAKEHKEILMIYIPQEFEEIFPTVPSISSTLIHIKRGFLIRIYLDPDNHFDLSVIISFIETGDENKKITIHPKQRYYFTSDDHKFGTEVGELECLFCNGIMAYLFRQSKTPMEMDLNNLYIGFKNVTDDQLQCLKFFTTEDEWNKLIEFRNTNRVWDPEEYMNQLK